MEKRVGDEELMFGTQPAADHSSVEYLFPKGSYALEGNYVIKGYFIVRPGGTHQGVVSIGFEKVDDIAVLLNPSITEKRTKSLSCK